MQHSQAEPHEIRGAEPLQRREQAIRREDHGRDAERREQEVERVARDDPERAAQARARAASERRRDHEQHGGSRREAQHRLEHDEGDPDLERHGTARLRGLTCCGRRTARGAAPVDVDALEAAHVDRGRLETVRRDAEPERRAAALGTEVMLDHVLVERVDREPRLGRREPQLVARHEPEEIALAAAIRAVALDDLTDLPLDLVCVLAAMTAAVGRASSLPSCFLSAPRDGRVRSPLVCLSSRLLVSVSTYAQGSSCTC